MFLFFDQQNKPFDYFKDFLSVSYDKAKGKIFGHYTKTYAFEKIAEGQTVGENGLKRTLFKLSDIKQLNDTVEATGSGNRSIYTMSLTGNGTESVAMWIAYGVPRSEAMRLNIPGEALFEVIDLIRNQGVFVKHSDNEPLQLVRPLQTDFAIIQYLPEITFDTKRKMYSLKKNNGHLWRSNFRFRYEWKQDNDYMPPVFKKSGWGHENEVRLIVLLEEQYNEDTQVFMDFSPFFKALDNHTATITLGPWAKYETFKKFNSKLEGGAQKSKYHEEIKVETACDVFKKRTGCGKVDCPARESKDDCPCWMSNHNKTPNADIQ